MEAMAAWVEVWPIAADQMGLWLLSGTDAWRPTLPVDAASEPHAEIELELAGHRAHADLLHSTSWRVDGPRVILTYVAVVGCPGLVRETWPDATPISVVLPDAVGHPPTHAATDPPAPRYIDVLLHSIRHLRLLVDLDATARATILGSALWREHLARFEPALAGMYQVEHTVRNR
jgi:hypothetical protein